MTERARTDTRFVVTQSSIKDWTRCRRKWFLGHYRRLRKVSDYRSPTTVGNLVNDGLAAYYDSLTSKRRVDPLKVIEREAKKLIAEMPDSSEAILKDVELALIMVEGYMEHLEETGCDYELKVIEPERGMEVQLKPGLWLLGKLDGKVLTRDGWTAFLEHKTTANFEDLPSIAQVDRQLLTYDLLEYLDLLEREGKGAKPRTDGAILNMLKKVKRTAAAKQPFYLRVEVRHNRHELRHHWRHVVALALEMQRASAALDRGADHHKVAPPAPDFSCRWSCQFGAVCLSGLMDDGSDWEGVAETVYEEHDPLARYGEGDA
jgi:hypothetical protein